jgi:hypothetical protein
MRLVKILTSDDGDKRDKDLQYWHLVEIVGGGPATFCQGEYFGHGESGCEYEEKEVKRGGITCPLCLERLKWVKSIKL